MDTNAYHFVTRWNLPATVQEVWDIIVDGERLSDWWPSVYLKVEVVQPGDEWGIGQVTALHTKGWLPYTLRWQFRVEEVIDHKKLAIEAWGDFVGEGVWTFEESFGRTIVTYDWRISAEKPLLKNLSFLMKPIFSFNHHWAMDMGEKSILLELERRRANTAEERALVPAPPAPTNALPFILIGAGAGLFVVYLIERGKKK